MKVLKSSKKMCKGIVPLRNKLFLSFFISIFLLSSCFSYQYVTVNSNLKQNEKKEFVIENDSVMIKYSFSGENFPMTISILNKLTQPIYIDWNRSTMVMNNLATNNTLWQNDQSGFLPPKSYANIATLPLKDQFFELNPNDSIKNLYVSVVNGTGGITEKLHYFSEKNTPLLFRSLLTLTTHEDFTSPMYYDNSFWVSGIFQTLTEPTSLSNSPANQFYFRKSTGFGNFLGCTSILSLVVLSAIIAPTEQ